MKNLLLTATILIISIAVKAQVGMQFVSQQHQQIKFDTAYNAYFIDSDSYKVAFIEVIKNAVILGGTKVLLSNDNIQSIGKKESFTINTQNENGAVVKLAFWFMDGELEEISFTDNNKVTTSYKDITVNSGDVASRKKR